MMCVHPNKHIGDQCYGCWLRAKNLMISGETVAGWTYGHQPKLTDKPIDQRLDAARQIEVMSKQMQAGGAVVEDRLQQPIEAQYRRAHDAADTIKSPLPEGFNG